MTCDPNHVVTQNDLNALEQHLDRVWKKLGIEVEFTKHFLDRVNDERNGKQITLCELARIFLETFRQYGKKLATRISKSSWEAVLTDKMTNINVPFILRHNGKDLEIVAKTVMRKPNFMTPDTKLMVAHYDGGKKMKKTGTKVTAKTLREWSGFGDPQVAPVGGVVAVDDVNINTSQIEDPEVLNMINGFLSSLCKKTFINPYYPVQQAFIKLRVIGLSFPLRGLDLSNDQGVVYLPINQFGGRIGMSLDGSWVDDDGISHKIPGGLVLKITYRQNNGEFVVSLSLCPANSVNDFLPNEDEPLDLSQIEEGVVSGLSDTTVDYPFDKTFQPDQDGETIFDSKMYESYDWNTVSEDDRDNTLDELEKLSGVKNIKFRFTKQGTIVAPQNNLKMFSAKDEEKISDALGKFKSPRGPIKFAKKLSAGMSASDPELKVGQGFFVWI